MIPLMLAVEPGNYALLIGVVILVAAVLRWTYRRQRQPGPTPKTFARDHIAKIEEEHAVRGDMQELMVQLQELARSINAQIETKFAKLETSIRSADERIETLERLLRAAQGQPSIDAVVGDEGEQARPTDDQLKSAPPDAAIAEVYKLADAGKDTVAIAQQTGQTPGEIELILSLRDSARSGRS